MQFGQLTIEHLQKRLSEFEAQAKSKRGAARDHLVYAEQARIAAEEAEANAAELKDLLGYIGRANDDAPAPHDPADCGTCDDHADTQRDQDRAEQQLDGAL
jgi:hypothetical protein